MPEDEIVDHAAIDRSRPVESIKRRQILDSLRPKLSANLLHARRFKLEDGIRPTLAKQLHSLLVVKRKLGPVDIFIKRVLYTL